MTFIAGTSRVMFFSPRFGSFTIGRIEGQIAVMGPFFIHCSIFMRTFFPVRIFSVRIEFQKATVIPSFDRFFIHRLVKGQQCLQIVAHFFFRLVRLRFFRILLHRVVRFVLLVVDSFIFPYFFTTRRSCHRCCRI